MESKFGLFGKGRIKITGCAAVTKKGRRSNNQDNFMLCGRYAAQDHETYCVNGGTKIDMPFFASVCDGMGGEASGERASFEACRELAKASLSIGKEFESNKAVIKSAILRSNLRLCNIMQEEQTGRMGSTVISVLVQDGKLYYTNLGDSRIYLLRNGVLSQITHDHTEGQSMVDAGVLTAEQLKTHPSRNKLNRHLGIFPEEMVLECAVYKDIDLVPGDKILLCSDGVFGVLTNENMAAIMLRDLPVKERAMQLVDTAYSSGSRDNMTAMVIDIGKQASFPVIPVLCGVLGVGLAVGAAFAVKGILSKNKEDTDRSADPTPTAETTEEPAETEPGQTELDETEEPDVTPTPDNVVTPTPYAVVTPTPYVPQTTEDNTSDPDQDDDHAPSDGGESDPYEPDQPGDPGQNTEPDQPGDPGQNTEPDQPGDPGQNTEPGQPSEPDQPTEP